LGGQTPGSFEDALLKLTLHWAFKRKIKRPEGGEHGSPQSKGGKSSKGRPHPKKEEGHKKGSETIYSGGAENKRRTKVEN